MSRPAELSLPETDDLRCFVAAARAPSFRAAAQRVALTPAALGQRIRRLEERLGCVLFARTTRSVHLTTAGMQLLPAADASLEALAGCGPAAREEVGPRRTELVLGTRHELGLSFVVPLLGALRRALPWLRLHLYFGSGPDLLLRVRTQEIDCAITSTRFSDPRLDALPLHEESYVFCASPRLLRAHPLRRADDARAHTLLDASPDLPLFRYLQEAPGAPTLRFGDIVRLGAIGAIHAETRAGNGVAVLPTYLVARDLATKRLVRVLPQIRPIADRFRLVFRADEPRRAVLDALAESLLRTPLR